MEFEERHVPRSPVVGTLVVPIGLLQAMVLDRVRKQDVSRGTQYVATRARQIVADVELDLCFEPKDCEYEKLGCDVESGMPDGRLRLTGVNSHTQKADIVTVTRNGILYSLNNPNDSILATAEFKQSNNHQIQDIGNPFRRDPDFGETSVNYNFDKLLARAEPPR